MSQTQRYIYIFGLAPVLLILDQITKYLVLSEPRFRSLECLDGTVRCGQIELLSFFDLTMVWNRGMSFGAMQSEGVMRWVLVMLTVAIASGFGVWMFKAARRLTTLALAMIVAGAIGNVIDRIRFGAVVDFLDFGGIWPPYFFPYVFNVADAAISVGAALLFLDQFLLSRETSKTANTNVTS